MINPDWDRSKKNFDPGFRLLILAGIIVVSISGFLKVQPAKNILLGIGFAFLSGGLVSLIIFKKRPGAFKDRSSDPGEK